MPHFKDPAGFLHFLDNVDTAPRFLPPGCVQITDEETASIRAEQNPPPTQDELILKDMAELEAEAARGGWYRAMREFSLSVMEDKAASLGLTPEQLYTVNIGYRKIKDLDNEIAALREKLT